MNQGYVSLLYIFPQEVVPHFYVFCSGMKNMIFRNTYGTSAVTKEWNMGTLLTKVAHSVGNPYELRTTASRSNIFSFCGGLGYARLLARRLRHQRRTQELTSTQGRLTIQPTPSKIHIRKTMKVECQRGKIPKTHLRSVVQVPKNPLHGLLM